MADKPLIFLDPFPRNEAMVYTPDVAAELNRMGRIMTHFGSRAPDTLVEKILPEVSVVIGQTAFPKERFDKAPNLKAILNVKANWEPNIDYAEAQARGIYVLSAAPAMAPAVAEFCLAQAITLARNLASADPLFRAGAEAYGIAGNKRSYSLYNAEVGLLGYGNLGRSLAPLLRPFGCKIRVFDPWLSEGFIRAQGLETCAMDELLATSQFLFLLAGVTSENEGFLDCGKLEIVRQDATVVLASRAEILNFDSFIMMAGQGRFRAAIDVYPDEPVPPDAAFRKTPGVLFSSHLAGGISASYGRIREMMLEDLGQILNGFPPLRMQRAEPALAAKMRSR